MYKSSRFTVFVGFSRIFANAITLSLMVLLVYQLRSVIYTEQILKYKVGSTEHSFPQ